MRQPNLTPLIQVLLLGSVGILIATAIFRFDFFRNQYVGRWTAEQAKTFEWLRLAIGASFELEDLVLSKCRFRTGFAMVALWGIAVFRARFATLGWAATTHGLFVTRHGTIGRPPRFLNWASAR